MFLLLLYSQLITQVTRLRSPKGYVIKHYQKEHTATCCEREVHLWPIPGGNNRVRGPSKALPPTMLTFCSLFEVKHFYLVNFFIL